MNKKMVAFRFPIKFIDELNAYAESHGVSKTKILYQAFNLLKKTPTTETKTNQSVYVICKYNVFESCFRSCSGTCENCRFWGSDYPELYSYGESENVSTNCENRQISEKTVAKIITDFELMQGDCINDGFVRIEDLLIPMEVVNYLFVDYGELKETIIQRNDDNFNPALTIPRDNIVYR